MVNLSELSSKNLKPQDQLPVFFSIFADILLLFMAC
jgi:hypothetical protein